jgi:hypothetical protein
VIKDFFIVGFIVISLITVELGTLVILKSHSSAKVLADSSTKFDKISGIHLSPIPKEAVLSASISSASVSAKSISGSSNNGTKNINPITNFINSVVNRAASKNPLNIGIYESFYPGDPASLDRLTEMAQAGFNVVLNYQLTGASVAEINNYLNKANSLGMKVIININDFYDVIPNPPTPLSSYSNFGTSNESVALGIVNTFKNNPAVWGWYISDEKPDSLGALPTWQPVLQDRYNKIKKADPNHPTLIVLGCYQGTVQDSGSMAKTLSSATDSLAFDAYPIPYEPTTTIKDCSSTLASSFKGSDKWFVVQNFSWVSYPDVVSSLNLDIKQARYPSLDEMKSMVSQARSSGINNFLFYSYFDLKKDSQNFSKQWSNVKSVVAGL